MGACGLAVVAYDLRHVVVMIWAKWLYCREAVAAGYSAGVICVSGMLLCFGGAGPCISERDFPWVDLALHL